MGSKGIGAGFEEILAVADLAAFNARNRGLGRIQKVCQALLGQPAKLAPFRNKCAAPLLWRSVPIGLAGRHAGKVTHNVTVRRYRAT